ncbi:MAG: dephospho-CoA kinase [Gallionella sp.]|nr:dephospho-CoA kinase [Gallionella sp.]
MSLVVGLTGGIGCGKSTVAALFSEQGADIVDADVISHQLTQADGAAIPAIRAAFGNGYIGSDGALDRAAMRALVFADVAARQRLEYLLHPLILARVEARLAEMSARPYVLAVVPLLLEISAFRRLVQRVLVVDCDESAQIERIARRGGMSDAEARAIIASQIPRPERLRQADDIIRNDELDGLASQVDALHRRYSQNSN